MDGWIELSYSITYPGVLTYINIYMKSAEGSEMRKNAQKYIHM